MIPIKLDQKAVNLDTRLFHGTGASKYNHFFIGTKFCHVQSSFKNII